MKKILLIVLSSCILAGIFTATKYAAFEKKMVTANYGMRAVCSDKDLGPLFIGSSMFRQGINTAEILPTSFLLSYNGNQPVLELLQLQEMLEKGADIKTLIIDMYAFSAADEPGSSDSRMVMDGDFQFSRKLYERLKDRENFSFLLKMVLQTNNELFVTMPVVFNTVNSRYDRGSSTTHPAGKTREFLEDAEMVGHDTTELNPEQVEAIIGIASLCREKDINLLFVESPKYHRVHEDGDYLALMSNYVNVLSGHEVSMIICKETSDRIAIPSDAKIQTFEFDHRDEKCYTDLVHLSGKGRSEFSQILSTLL